MVTKYQSVCKAIVTNNGPEKETKQEKFPKMSNFYVFITLEK